MNDLVKREPMPLALGRDDAQGADLDVRHHMGILRRRMWVVILCFVVVFTIAAVKTFRATPVYEATAKLLVERRIPQMAALGQMGETRDEKYYSTQIKLITGKAVLEKALEDEDVAAVFADKAAPVAAEGLIGSVRSELRYLLADEQARPTEPWERLRERVSVRPVEDSDLVQVTVRGTDPSQCALLANAVSRAYVDYSIAMEKENAGEVFELLQRQMKEQEQALAAAEDRLIEYREQSSVAELGTGENGSEMDRWRKLNDEYTTVQLRRIELSVAAEDIEARRADDADPAELLAVAKVRNDAGVMQLVDRREKVTMDRDSALRALGERHPDVVALSDQLTYVESRLDDAIDRVADSIEAEHAMLLNRERDLRQALDGESENALERARKAQVYQRLERDAQRQTRVFEVIVDRMKEVDLIKDEGMTNVTLIEKAVLPQSPVSPNKQRNLILGAFLGLMFGVGLAYGLSFLDDTVKNPEDVEEALKLPWLGYVPKMRGLGSGGLASSARQVLDDPSGSTAEAFRSIRTNIYFSGQRDQMKSIIVTSATPGEGKTVFSSNLAAAIAHDGKRVLLVDADLRRPMIHRAYSVERRDGLTNMLVEGRDLSELVKTPMNGHGPALPNLHILTAGSKAPNPAELLGGPAMLRFMERAREEYDMVIYDSCPAMFVADNAALASNCDGVVMVVQSSKTRKNAARQAHRQLDAVDGNVIGVVLNKVKQREMRYYGSYGGYYYSYDYYYDDYRDDEAVEEIGASAASRATLPEGRSDD